tara:strand:+ start:44022 stop:44627 length:606 start_codon:yes stop_codon:yes gene_type:complete
MGGNQTKTQWNPPIQGKCIVTSGPVIGEVFMLNNSNADGCKKTLQNKGVNGYWETGAGIKTLWEWTHECVDENGNTIIEVGINDRGKCTAALANLVGGGQYASTFGGQSISTHSVNGRPQVVKREVKQAEPEIKTAVTIVADKKDDEAYQALLVKFAANVNTRIATYNAAIEANEGTAYASFPQLQKDLANIYAEYGENGL